MHNHFFTTSPVRKTLMSQARRLASVRISELFNRDAKRVEKFTHEIDGLYIDFSKNKIDAEVVTDLLSLARAAGVEEWRDKMLAGEHVNLSEDRPALHTALRDPNGTQLMVDDRDIRLDIQQGLSHMERLVEKMRSKQWLGTSGKPITDIIHIGIGGSILGPATAAQALSRKEQTSIQVHFVSNVDASALMPILDKLDPETTLVIAVSKSFDTLETLTNAKTAKTWLLRSMPESGLSKHLMAVTACPDKAVEFGIDPDHILAFWPWVGGRFSLWSTVGLPIAICAGMDVFYRLLDGARAMDEHFSSAPLEKNIPVQLALIGIWNANFQNIAAHAVLPYDDRLATLPAHLQQLEMESSGKSIDRHGKNVDWKTSPIIFGMSGTDAQHTFFQTIHQGTREVSADFIGCLRNDHEEENHHEQLLSNLFAQAEALMLGWSTSGSSEQDQQRLCPGDRPSTTILLDCLSPENLGMLLALFEHKVFVQGVIWGINPFDQWGVELGKKLADRILGEIDENTEVTSHDQSTNSLINRYLNHRRNT